jgi:hypothetical protein
MTDQQPFRFAEHPDGVLKASELKTMSMQQQPAYWVVAISDDEAHSGVYRCETAAEAAALTRTLMSRDVQCFAFHGRYLPSSVPLAPLWAGDDSTDMLVVELQHGLRPEPDALAALVAELEAPPSSVTEEDETEEAAEPQVSESGSESNDAELGDFGEALFDDEEEPGQFFDPETGQELLDESVEPEAPAPQEPPAEPEDDDFADFDEGDGGEGGEDLA